MNNRIKQILDYTGMNQNEFADRIAVSSATLSNILKGKSNATLPIVMSIRASFPELNFDWLLEGKGEMLKSDTPASEVIVNTDNATQNAVDAAAAMSQFPGDLFSAAPNYGYAPSGTQSLPKNSPLQTMNSNRVREHEISQSAKIIDKPQRKIKEIRVFFDDDTFEVFVPSKG